MGDLSDVAELILSELLTNALKAMAESVPAPPPGSRITAVLRPRGLDAVSLSVHDYVPCEIKVEDTDVLDDYGKGLPLVEALTGGWWVEPTPQGKRVCCRLTREPEVA